MQSIKRLSQPDLRPEFVAWGSAAGVPLVGTVPSKRGGRCRMNLQGEVRSAGRRESDRARTLRRAPPRAAPAGRLGLVLLVLLPLLPGCTRSFYRTSADNEVSHVLAEKDSDPA